MKSFDPRKVSWCLLKATVCSAQERPVKRWSLLGPRVCMKGGSWRTSRSPGSHISVDNDLYLGLDHTLQVAGMGSLP
jgi:hypothetical protein